MSFINPGADDPYGVSLVATRRRCCARSSGSGGWSPSPGRSTTLLR